ncbi:MAG: UpxY family transcription antiterminator [Bacteroidaceae bacterium]|nr:UpxY family transcription antiterminator [Bacteroidaceae bacterium]
MSVRYAYDSSKQWFVFRATYGRESKALSFLETKGIEAYLPQRWTVRQVGNSTKRVKEPLLPNLLFAYCSLEQAEVLIKHTPELQYLNYYYNHLQCEPDGKNPPLTVKYEQMMNFIAVTSAPNEHIRLIDASRCHFKSGDKVRVVNGSFTGVEGKVARISGQQRVVVEIDGLCAVATAYIPTAFLEKEDLKV